jgi:Trypsin
MKREKSSERSAPGSSPKLGVRSIAVPALFQPSQSVPQAALVHFMALMPLTALLACSGGELAADGALANSAHAIESGEVDDVHRSVFRVITRADGYNALCSATLIAPNLMLTARHCVAKIASESVDCDVDEFMETARPEDLLFSNDTSPTLLSRWFGAREVVVDEDSAVFCGNDVGLVILEDNVPEAVAVPSEVRLEPIVVQDEPYVAVGYGGDMGDSTAQYGVRRSRADLVVECVGRICGQAVTEEEFGGSGGGCPGDSGGPALDRELRVLGALSRGHDECMAPVYSAASQFAPLLLTVAQRAAELGEYSLPIWAGGMAPEPGSALGTDAGTPSKAQGGDREPERGGLEDGGGCALPRAAAARGGGLSLLLGFAALGAALRKRRAGM